MPSSIIGSTAKEFRLPTNPFSEVETLGEVETESLTHRVIRQALRQFPDTRKVYRALREQMHAAIKERVYEISHLMPAERYIKLLETKPWVFEYVEEVGIAAYMGMSPDQFRCLRQKILFTVSKI
jgi:hypothetical protein